MLDFDKYECYNLPHITTCPGLLYTINPDTYTPQCPLCLTDTHDTNHFFNCSQVGYLHNTTPLVCGKSF